ncbi:Reverse gyrase [bacterium HR39]|nr:Reverse gyrase [bacterium HR39]
MTNAWLARRFDRLDVALAERLLRTPHAITRRHLALYDLVVRRFLASQARAGEVVRGRWRIALPELGIGTEMEGPREARGETDLVAALEALYAEIAPLRGLAGIQEPGVAVHREDGAAEPAGTA